MTCLNSRCSREENVRLLSWAINSRKIVVTAFNSHSILANYYFSRDRPFPGRRFSASSSFVSANFFARRFMTVIRRPRADALRSALFAGTISRSSIIRGVVPSTRGFWSAARRLLLLLSLASLGSVSPTAKSLFQQSLYDYFYTKI